MLQHKLVGNLIRRAIEVGEGWEDNKLMNLAAAEIVRLQKELDAATSKLEVKPE